MCVCIYIYIYIFGIIIIILIIIPCFLPVDGSYHYVDGFRVELRTVDHYLIKYVTVDVERQPRDEDGKVLT